MLDEPVQTYCWDLTKSGAPPFRVLCARVGILMWDLNIASDAGEGEFSDRHRSESVPDSALKAQQHLQNAYAETLPTFQTNISHSHVRS